MSQRTPDQQFAFHVKVAMFLFFIAFSYFIFADLNMPMTPQARVYRNVVQVAPQVSGPIQDVFVDRNQTVQPGDILFEIDNRAYELAVEKAELDLEDVIKTNYQLDAQINASEAKLLAVKAALAESESNFNRALRLVKTKAISTQQLERYKAQFLRDQADVEAGKADLNLQRISRGDKGKDNVALKQAINNLKSAQLNLEHTRVKASEAGIISNMQLSSGLFAIEGEPLLSVVDKHLDLVADFREKSLFDVNEETTAKVVFDALPGEVFDAHLDFFEAGVSDGQLLADGNLAKVETSNRWVRDAQRQRLHLSIDEPDERLSKLTSGARATVQIVPNNPLMGFLATLQIRTVSFLHFIY
ncbi:TPA: HlyD family secretion protein [Vibrio alginolyticus]